MLSTIHFTNYVERKQGKLIIFRPKFRPDKKIKRYGISEMQKVE